ncbi:hypothetical protein XFF6166_10212 [Xanthomonas citri pv. fuscans]|nr:hypothetical protein XFF6166_10212 [Xanthomonas citri pv. fuscans]
MPICYLILPGVLMAQSPPSRVRQHYSPQSIERAYPPTLHHNQHQA